MPNNTGIMLGGAAEGNQMALDSAQRQQALNMQGQQLDLNKLSTMGTLALNQQKMVIEDAKERRQVVDSLTSGVKDALTGARDYLTQNPGADPTQVDYLIKLAKGFTQRLDLIQGADSSAANSRSLISSFEANLSKFNQTKTGNIVAESGAQGVGNVVKATAENQGGLGTIQGQTKAQEIDATTPAEARKAGAIAGATKAVELSYEGKIAAARVLAENAADPTKVVSAVDKLLQDGADPASVGQIAAMAAQTNPALAGVLQPYIAGKVPGKGERDANKPASAEQQKQGALVTEAQSNFDAAQSRLMPNGKLDRGIAAAMQLNVPGTQGGIVRQQLRAALGNMVYLKTGAAATEKELDNLERTYIPTARDSDQVAANKFNSAKTFLSQFQVKSPQASTARAPVTTFEGTTATNPQTGQKVIFKGGQWVSAQ